MKQILIVLCAASLAGCGGVAGGGEGFRWAGSAAKHVHVEGVPYQVQYVRAGNGYDMRTVRTEAIVIAPDRMTEERRGRAAALLAADELGCRMPVVVSSQGGDLVYVRVDCGA